MFLFCVGSKELLHGEPEQMARNRHVTTVRAPYVCNGICNVYTEYAIGIAATGDKEDCRMADRPPSKKGPEQKKKHRKEGERETKLTHGDPYKSKLGNTVFLIDLKRSYSEWSL